MKAMFHPMGLAALVTVSTACGVEAPEAHLRSESPNGANFTIELRYLSDVEGDMRAAFERAGRRWSSVIRNDLTNARIERGSLPEDCGGTSNGEVLDIDDLLIFVSVEAIDGPRGVLGAAGPCVLRSDTDAPLIGRMRFDRADLEALQEAELLETVVLHEMGHVLGIGTLWNRLGLLALPSLPDSPGSDTHFVGPQAQATFRDLGVDSFSGSIVPVENLAEPGSSDGHWRETVLGSELMSPRLSDRAVVSTLTIASLADLGFYETDESAADPFVPDTPSSNTLRLDENPSMYNCQRLPGPATFAPSERPSPAEPPLWVPVTTDEPTRSRP